MCLPFFRRFIQTDKLIVPTASGMSSIRTFFTHWRFWLQNHHKLHLKVLMLHVGPCGQTTKKRYESDAEEWLLFKGPSVSWTLMLRWQRSPGYTSTFVFSLSKSMSEKTTGKDERTRLSRIWSQEVWISYIPFKKGKQECLVSVFPSHKWSDLNFEGSQFQPHLILLLLFHIQSNIVR